MRKITQNTVNAFYNKKHFVSGSNMVTNRDSVTTMYLHGNAIATDSEKQGLRVSTAGWDTSTTKERLNGLNGVNVRTIKGELHLNGEKWDGSWQSV